MAYERRGGGSSGAGGDPALGGDLSGTASNAQIAAGAIVNADISGSAAIALAKLATDPLARANHTGSQAQSTVTNLVTDLAAKVPTAQVVNAQTGTTYTLVDADAGKLVTLSNASGITLTVPQDSDATIAIGTYVDLMALGAGQVTVAAGTGATLRVSGLTAKSRAQYARFGVQKIAANTWSLFGDLAAS